MIASYALSWLAARWPALLLLAVLASGWTAAWVQTQRLERAQEALQAAQDRERQARVLAFDEALRQRRIAQETERAYQESAARAAAVAGDVSRRLQRYLANEVRDRAAPVVADGPAPVAGSSQELGRVLTHLGELIRACSQDSARLEALQAWAERVTAKPE